MEWDVHVEAYHGPLDLLLELIKENQVDIYNIPIAQIADQYLLRLDEMRQLNLSIAGEFLVMAATLIYIKSKMLLPEELADDEEEADGDPRMDLVNKLIEYQSYKEAAKDLDVLQHERQLVYRRLGPSYTVFFNAAQSREETLSTSLYDLIQAFSSVLKSRSLQKFHEVYEEEIPIEAKILAIQAVLSQKREVYFDDLFQDQRTRNELIATFLALLEIIRAKKARIQQEMHFSQIKIMAI